MQANREVPNGSAVTSSGLDPHQLPTWLPSLQQGDQTIGQSNQILLYVDPQSEVPSIRTSTMRAATSTI